MTTKADLTEPTAEYITKVQEAVKDLDEFKEEDVSKLLAFSCWRHNEPFSKEYFESETIQFSDDDKETLDGFIDKLDAFIESQDQNSNSNFAEHPTHYHGSSSHTHEGGDKSHTHEDKPGTYSQTKPSSDNSEEEMFAEQVRESLGLEKGATSEQVIGAIAAIKSSSFSEEQKSSFEEMQRSYRVAHYMEETVNLKAMPGTPKEQAEKLAELEAKTSTEIADERLAEWKSYQEMADTAGVTSTLLQSRKHAETDGDNTIGPAEIELKKYATDEKVTFPVALAKHAAGTEPMKKIFHTYYAEQNPTE